MSQSFIKKPGAGPLSALADTGVLRSHMEALNTRLAAEQPVVPLRLPVSADEWTVHAPTTIRDASGEVLAECSGHGRHSVEDEAVAAEIVRRVNAHDELVRELRNTAAFLQSACLVMLDSTARGMALAQVSAAQRVISKAGAAA